MIAKKILELCSPNEQADNNKKEIVFPTGKQRMMDYDAYYTRCIHTVADQFQ